MTLISSPLLLLLTLALTRTHSNAHPVGQRDFASTLSPRAAQEQQQQQQSKNYWTYIVIAVLVVSSAVLGWIYLRKRKAKKYQEAIQSNGGKGADPYLPEPISGGVSYPEPAYTRDSRSKVGSSSRTARQPRESRKGPSARDDVVNIARVVGGKVEKRYKNRVDTNKRAKEIFKNGMAENKRRKERRRAEEALSP